MARRMNGPSVSGRERTSTAGVDEAEIVIWQMIRLSLFPAKPGTDHRNWCRGYLPIAGSIVPLCCSKPTGHYGPHTAYLGGTGEPVFSWEDHRKNGLTGWGLSQAEMMKYLPICLILLASCSTRHLPATPSFLTIHATAASCTGPTDTHWEQCRYTVEDSKSMHVRRIEFRKAK